MKRWVNANEALDSSRAPVEIPRLEGDEAPVTATWDRYMPSWHRQALCRKVEDWDDTFFGENPDDDESRASLNQDRIRRASTVCHTCDVIRECAAHALTRPEDHGIWAGTTPKMRERARDLIQAGLMDLETVIDIIAEGNAHAFKDFQASLQAGLKDVI